MNKNQKSDTYERLQDALTQEGCPLCYLGQQAGHNYLDRLLYEFVNDFELRERLNRSMGFCSRHNHKLLSYPGQRLGVSIIQQSLIKEAIKRLQQHQIRPSPSIWRQIEAELRSNNLPEKIDLTAAPLSDQACTACQKEREAEERALKELLANLVDDLDKPLKDAGGLCWPHLQGALPQASDPEIHSRLVQLQNQIWQNLVNDLGEFIRKNDYRFYGETISDDEKTAAARSISTLVGTSPE